MIKITDLKSGEAYGAFVTGRVIRNYLGEIVTISFVDKNDNTFEIECIVPEKVNAIEALVAMENGKYASEGEAVYKITDGKVKYAHRIQREPWRFTGDVIGLNSFLSRKFEILDKLPEWAKEPKKNNPFKVGDIVGATTRCERKMLREVVAVKPTHVKYTTYDGKPRTTSVDFCTLATLEERAEFYEKAYKHIKNN